MLCACQCRATNLVMLPRRTKVRAGGWEYAVKRQSVRQGKKYLSQIAPVVKCRLRRNKTIALLLKQAAHSGRQRLRYNADGYAGMASWNVRWTRGNPHAIFVT